MGNSRIYKVTFEDGMVHFGRVSLSKGYSEKTYITNLLSGFKHNINNPNRVNKITDFERKVVNESNTLVCEIVFEGEDKEAISVKDRMIRETKNCMNSRKSTEVKRGKNETLKVKKEFVKTLVNNKGEKLFFILIERVMKRKLNEKVNFNVKHPIKSDFVLCNTNVEVI